ncbi:hypothetical protein B0H17DRAFT_384433 [Mycena rosella]|uniref:Uncharacterized protein n=1 Tax=Mycena rosella TaxID=1033263 RepID=A0AAD7G388_MYCRO|nr:hypothetical protein B0H17DRAFT_384433 [Mycena rosella]
MAWMQCSSDSGGEGRLFRPRKDRRQRNINTRDARPFWAPGASSRVSGLCRISSHTQLVVIPFCAVSRPFLSHDEKITQLTSTPRRMRPLVYFFTDAFFSSSVHQTIADLWYRSDNQDPQQRSLFLCAVSPAFSFSMQSLSSLRRYGACYLLPILFSSSVHQIPDLWCQDLQNLTSTLRRMRPLVYLSTDSFISSVSKQSLTST